jgi:hypothetical protein
MKYLTITLPIVFLLTACTNITSGDKYQITTATDGAVYRLDKLSGEIWLVKGNIMEKLPVKDFSLKVGQRYIGEDAYSFIYIGKGQVGDIKDQIPPGFKRGW